MIRAILHISGNVQHANYRSKVVSIAKKHNVTGNVQNRSDGTVKVIAEGEETDIEKFIQDINIKNTLINVTDLKKGYSTSTGEYESFYKLVSEGETDERLDTAADLLKELINVTRTGFTGLENKIDQNRLEIKSEIHALRDDFKAHFDNRLSKIEFELTDIKIKVPQIIAIPVGFYYNRLKYFQII